MAEKNQGIRSLFLKAMTIFSLDTDHFLQDNSPDFSLAM